MAFRFSGYKARVEELLGCKVDIVRLRDRMDSFLRERIQRRAFMYDTLIAFHILDLIQKSLERISFRFSDISCPDDFLLSESGMMKLDSICMKLTAIGESIKNLDKVTNKELLAQYPEIPWRYVMGVRDIIVHHYFDVDADEIYRICLEDIPQLQQAIKRMLDDLKTDNLIMG